MILRKLEEYKQKRNQFRMLQEKINMLEELKVEESCITDLIKSLEKSKAFVLCELSNIDAVLEVLEEEDSYLIRNKSILERPWTEIEKEYNTIFRKKPSLSEDALRKKHQRAIKALERDLKILEELCVDIDLVHPAVV